MSDIDNEAPTPRLEVDAASAARSSEPLDELEPRSDLDVSAKRRRQCDVGLVSPLSQAIARAEESVAERARIQRAPSTPDESAQAVAPTDVREKRAVFDAEPARQLLLALDQRPGKRANRILVSESNQLAVALAETPDQWRAGFACLVGPEGSGKSLITRHLYPDAVRLAPRDCVEVARLDALSQTAIHESAVLIFDDLDVARRLNAGSGFEIGLFHLLNRVADAGARLLATSREAPSRFRTSMPDLKTRLDAATIGVIEAPDDVLLTALLMKLFDDCGLEVESVVIGYLVKRMERSYAAAADLVDKLNRASLEQKRAVTTPLAAATLGWRPQRF